MPKAMEDDGAFARFTKPFKPRVYEEGKLPCPTQNAGAFISVVNRHTNGSLCTMQSDGSSWRRLKFADEDSGSTQLVPVERDLTPMIRAAVEQCLPALVTQPAVKVIQAPQASPNDLQSLAQGMLEISEHVNSILNQNAELMARIEFLESRAIVDARLVDVA